MNGVNLLRNGAEAFVLLALCTAQSAGAEGSPTLTGTAYLTPWFGSVVAVIDLAAGTVTQTIPIGVHNHNVALRPDKRQAWVTNNNAGNVSIIDTVTDSIVNTVTVPKAPEAITIKQ